jgi:hypothetical protein
MFSKFYSNKLIHISTRAVSHCGLAIYIKKYLKAENKLLKTQIFSNAKM